MASPASCAAAYKAGVLPAALRLLLEMRPRQPTGLAPYAFSGAAAALRPLLLHCGPPAWAAAAAFFDAHLTLTELREMAAGEASPELATFAYTCCAIAATDAAYRKRVARGAPELLAALARDLAKVDAAAAHRRDPIPIGGGAFALSLILGNDPGVSAEDVGDVLGAQPGLLGSMASVLFSPGVVSWPRLVRGPERARAGVSSCVMHRPAGVLAALLACRMDSLDLFPSPSGPTRVSILLGAPSPRAFCAPDGRCYARHYVTGWVPGRRAGEPAAGSVARFKQSSSAADPL